MDNDPLVLAFARALLTSSPSRMLMGIMGHFTDDEAYPIVSRLPSDSYLALYDDASANEAFNQYNASSAVPYLRSPVLRVLVLVELGVTPIMQ